MHVIAPKSIRSMKDLEGKKVSVDLRTRDLRHSRDRFRAARN